MELLTVTNNESRASIRAIRRARSEADMYKAMLRRMVVACAILVGLLISITVNYVRSTDAYRDLADINTRLSLDLDKANSRISSLNTEVSNLRSTIHTLETELESEVNTHEATKLQLKKLNNAYVELSTQQDDLVADNKQLKKDIKTLEARKELYDKYSYAIIDKSGRRTDLSYDNIKTGEELAKENGIDPDLVFGIMMTESGGDAKATNSKSTARGLGQVLRGTGKFVYEKVQGHGSGTYNHDMAFNPSTNISLVCSYLGYLKSSGKSAYATIKSYRGVEPTAYIRTIDSYISKAGTSFSDIAANW